MNVASNLDIEPDVVMPILKMVKDRSGKILVTDSARTIFVLPEQNIHGSAVMALHAGCMHYHPCRNSDELLELFSVMEQT